LRLGGKRTPGRRVLKDGPSTERGPRTKKKGRTKGEGGRKLGKTREGPETRVHVSL